MKTINNFIVEHLEYSTFPIDEKLKISSKSKFYSCCPKDKFELREILEKRLAEDKNADLNDIDVSQITGMGFKGFKRDKGLFEDLDPHNIDISEWNVSNVTDMWALFYKCYNFNCDLSKWDVSKVENMRTAFNECKKFTGKGLENWNVSNVKDMSFTFYCCSNFDSNLSDWDVSKVKDMNSMFYECTKFNSDLSNWNVSNVTDMESMFEDCYEFTGEGLENWNVTNLISAHLMFEKCKSLKKYPSWYKWK